MQEKKERPTLVDVAGWMALPIGLMWSASFFCTMYGTGHPVLSMLSTALGLISIYMLSKQLKNYRRQFPSVSWLHILRLSFVTCLLAGLLTDAVQYAYFLLLDDGRLLSLLNTALQSEEYRQAWQKMFPETDIGEVQKLVQTMTVRDIMLQLAFYNILLAFPISLIAAIASPKPSPKGKDTNSNS